MFDHRVRRSILPRPRFGEDAEHGSGRARLACRHGAIDSLAREELVPRRRPLLAVEIAGEIDQEPIPLLPRQHLQLPARHGIEVDNPWGNLAPGGARDEHCGEPERETAPTRSHTVDLPPGRARLRVAVAVVGTLAGVDGCDHGHTPSCVNSSHPRLPSLIEAVCSQSESVRALRGVAPLSLPRHTSDRTKGVCLPLWLAE